MLRGLRDHRQDGAAAASGADGTFGLWAALNGVFPTTDHQRCWNHRTPNMQAKLPKALHPEAKRRLKGMSIAPTRSECEYWSRCSVR